MPATTSLPESDRANPRKAAIVCHYFPHYRTGLLNKLANSPWHDYIFLADTSDPQSAGIKGSPITMNERFRRLKAWVWRGVYIQPGLFKWALGSSVDTLVIVAIPHGITNWLVPLVARLRGKKVIFWTIGWIQDERGLKNISRILFYSLANSLLIYGHNGKQLAMNRGFRPENIHVVYNSLDYEKQKAERERVTSAVIAETRAELFCNAEVPILVCSSRLQAHRQLNLVIEAMAILKDKGIDVNLLLIGDGPEKDKLKQLTRDSNVQVNFYGACYDETVLARLIMASDLTVAPGMVGLTAMQSLSYGTPVLTHDDIYNQAPESESLEDGLTGAFFKYQDVKDLASKIENWFANKKDRDLIRRACYSIIERFYNPEYQARVIDRAVAGLPADDLFAIKEVNHYRSNIAND